MVTQSSPYSGITSDNEQHSSNVSTLSTVCGSHVLYQLISADVANVIQNAGAVSWSAGSVCLGCGSTARTKCVPRQSARIGSNSTLLTMFAMSEPDMCVAMVASSSMFSSEQTVMSKNERNMHNQLCKLGNSMYTVCGNGRITARSICHGRLVAAMTKTSC